MKKFEFFDSEKKENEINAFETHEKCIARFKEVLGERGYAEKKPLSLIAGEQDSSVLFIGSSTNVFKPEIKNKNIPENGMFVVQPCIRTHDFKRRFDDTFVPFGQTYFEMIGAILPGDKYEKACLDMIEFLIKGLNIEKERILIIPTQENEKLLDPFYSNSNLSKIKIAKDKNKEYRWGYGMPGIYGEGLSVNILNTMTNKYWDVGNIVSINNEQDKEIAVEFGAGIEFLMSARLGIDNPVKLSRIADIEKINGGLHQKFCVYYETILQLIGAGASVGSKKGNRLFKQYLKSINYLSGKINYNIEDLKNIAQNYINKQGLKIEESELEKSLSFIEKHQERIKNFFSLLDRICLSMDGKGKEKFNNPKETIQKYLKDKRIRKEEIIEHVLLNYKQIKDIL